jgi:chorismate-pyruvate lyase
MYDTPSTISPDKARADMASLYAVFGDPADQVPRCEPIVSASMPEPARRLLAHENHMTVTLEEFCAAPVNVIVMKVCRNGNLYARKILLSDSKTGQIVQFGIMRFNFSYCNDEIREEILAEEAPLGRILIEHNVMRRISTHALLKITPNREIMEAFHLDQPARVYGRFATIFCDDEPAVDLLEIVNVKS